MSLMALPITELSDISSGYHFRTKVYSVDSGNVAVIQAKDIDKKRNVLWEDIAKISYTGSLAKYRLYDNDILLSMRGSSYYAAFLPKVPEFSIASSQFFRIRVLKPHLLLPQFLAWQLNQEPARRFFSQVETGSLVKRLRMADVRNLQIHVPGLERQKNILTFDHLLSQENDNLRDQLSANQELLDYIAQEELLGVWKDHAA